MTIDERSSLVDVAFIVCTVLEADGVIAVLTGGSAAVVYSADVTSYDIDFIVSFRTSSARPHRALTGLGFRATRGHYVHERSAFIVEFPPGPLLIGGERIKTHSTIEDARGRLHILSRTDCVRDRLAAFYFWNDRGSLRSAIRVASSGAIDLSAIARWSEREAHREEFEEFRSALTLP